MEMRNTRKILVSRCHGRIPLAGMDSIKTCPTGIGFESMNSKAGFRADTAMDFHVQ
jgi:hypothetical protein